MTAFAATRQPIFDADLSCMTYLCTRCGERWPEDFFSPDGGKPASRCKACRTERQRQYYARRGSALRKAQRMAGNNRRTTVKVKELIRELLDEDMDADVYVHTGKDGMPLDGITYTSDSPKYGDVYLEPESELKDARD